MEKLIQKDIESLKSIEAIQTILKTINEITGLKNAAVVTLAEGKWTAASVLQDNDFGLNVGDQLNLEDTY